jgi:hypothetical protein
LGQKDLTTISRLAAHALSLSGKRHGS